MSLPISIVGVQDEHAPHLMLFSPGLETMEPLPPLEGLGGMEFSWEPISNDFESRFSSLDDFAVFVSESVTIQGDGASTSYDVFITEEGVKHSIYHATAPDDNHTFVFASEATVNGRNEQGPSVIMTVSKDGVDIYKSFRGETEFYEHIEYPR
ncbi:hypothetical protein [Massilia sp. BJB1822]|uniref:hypothetical protein n=1 Tax=Massilia sp. BJB1822 TaxID=2744470 RepID=UPI00159483AE|nr:hypothetical protein [Massilia sp. BJB1822]NVD98887.1 hypothetical protein [Massilia sp. BJB1822]